MNDNQPEVTMGAWPLHWRNAQYKNIVMSITESCNLRCKYCYQVHKNGNAVMSIDVGERIIDYILSDKTMFHQDSVVFDFIGGEPLLEIDLIDHLTDYFRYKAYKLNHPWFNFHRISISTNGILYDHPKVQKYINKNINKLYIGISVDGNKQKHDNQRVKVDGSGSFDDVKRIVPLWLQQFPGASTKATFAPQDIPLIKDSVIALWEMGIKDVMANVVMEDVWSSKDPAIFESQLKELGDYILENDFWKDGYNCRFFDPSLGLPLSEDKRSRNWCGAGSMMICVDHTGSFYPCQRFLQFCLTNHKAQAVGDIYQGIDQDLVRRYIALDMTTQNDDECNRCNVASGCSLCSGNNYDLSEHGTIYKRAKYICEMHKANVRAVEYFWNKFTTRTNMSSPRDKERKDNAVETGKVMYLLTSDRIAPHCSYRNQNKTENIMSESMIREGIKFANKNGYMPVILSDNVEREINDYYTISSSKLSSVNQIPIFEGCGIDKGREYNSPVCVLRVDKTNIENVSNYIESLASVFQRQNVVLADIETWNEDDIARYEHALDNVIKIVVNKHGAGSQIEINILTDVLNNKTMRNCNAGISSITLAPDGKIYLCPAFYFDKTMTSIGDLHEGIKKNYSRHIDISGSPVCNKCDSFQCKRCIYLNKVLTGELNIPARNQCVISHIERKKSYELQRILNSMGYYFDNTIGPVSYLEPFDLVKNNLKGKICV